MAFSASNVFITPTIIAKEALMQLENNLIMGNRVHRGYAEEFDKIGGSVKIRKPVKFTVTKSRVRSNTDVTESWITLNVATQAHVSWQFYSKDLTLTIEQYSERYILPACIALANQVDVDVLGLYVDIYNQVEDTTDLSEDPKTFLCLGKAARKLDENACPQDDRSLVINPAGNWSLANALKNMFVTSVSKPALTKGYLTTIANMGIYMDQNIQNHSAGDFNTTHVAAGSMVTPTASWTGAVGSFSHMEMLDHQGSPATYFLRQGDIFTIAGVYSVNPVSGASTGVLKQFVVNADASITTSTTASDTAAQVFFSPGMLASGPYKNVSALPGAASQILIIGNRNRIYPQNLCFHKNAFALVTVPLEVPDSVAFSASETHNGLSIRVVKQYSIEEDSDVIRLDILYGVKTLYPELAVRVFGKQST